jgi:hypothetical protein
MTDKKTSVSARWRKQPDEKGLARTFQNKRGLELREGTTIVMRVAPSQDRMGRGIDGWYWYGLGKNTCQEPCATQEEAKAQADAHYKQWKKTQSASEGADS